MNEAKFTAFGEAYRDALARAVLAHPEEYFYGVEFVPAVADKMLRAMSENPKMVNYGGHGFKWACKSLGIKHTRKAIFAYLEIEK